MSSCRYFSFEISTDFRFDHLSHFLHCRVSLQVALVGTYFLQAASAVIVKGDQRPRNTNNFWFRSEFERHHKFGRCRTQFWAEQSLLQNCQLWTRLGLELEAKLFDFDFELSFDRRLFERVDDRAGRRSQDLVRVNRDCWRWQTGRSQIAVSLKNSKLIFLNC